MKKGFVSTIIGLLLIAAAFCMVAYNIMENRRAGAASDAVLGQLSSQIEAPVTMPVIHADDKKASEVEYPDYVLNPQMAMPIKTVDGRDYIGLLEIPALGLSLPIQNEWDYANLNISPCHYTGSAYLDNMVICAHNYDKHFGSIKTLSYGEPVIFTDMDGNRFCYSVTEVETLQPTAIEQMTTGDWDMTLFTCTIGGATRVTVRCTRSE